MELRICDNKEEWDNWFRKQGQNEFLQSWDWGEFQTSTSKPTVRLQAVENGVVRQAHHKVVWQGQAFEHKLGLGIKYLYLPKFSIFNFSAKGGSASGGQFSILEEFIKKYNFSFIRIEPTEKLQVTGYKLQVTRNRQPRTTLVLDLTQSEETLLANMHPKTRYNISLAERKGVQIRDEKNIEVFWKLNQTTTERDEFKSHDKEYYEKMLQFDFTRQLTAYFQGQPIAVILLVVFGDTCTYLHGASANEFRNLMAPYLLQWRGIQLAKKMGCKYYDFWGISPAPQINEPSSCFHNFCWSATHRWTGVTRFKAGFGGIVREYPQAVDVVLSQWKYGLYKLIHKFV